MKKLLIPCIAIGGILTGMFVHNSLFSHPEPVPFMSTNELTAEDAHKMSVAFRTSAGYCQSGNCSSTEGIFDLSEQTVSGMLSAMAEIKASAEKAPYSYRCIFGKNIKNETIIMMVPLDANRNEMLGKNMIQKVAGTLPCPTLCDITKSVVVMGSSARGESCCK